MGGIFGFRFGGPGGASPQMKLFGNIGLWMDPLARGGAEAMAVDEWLLETATQPILRVYRWAGAWASLGYFGAIADARGDFPEVDLVRRWTGGGLVDHRHDWTYTVVAPKGERMAAERGAETYRAIHAVLARVLGGEAIPARLSTGTEETGAARCFDNPVNHDLIGSDHQKIAGAGQHRNRSGLLHQGSVAARCRDEEQCQRRASHFATALAERWEWLELVPPSDWITRLVTQRYGAKNWTERR